MENKVLNCESCDPCKRDGCNESMCSWCIDCAEALCQDCDKHHRKSKTSASHNTVPLQKLKSASDFLHKFTQTCSDHAGGRIAFYCTKHDKLCCPSCVTLHQKECNDIITLEEAAAGVKTSEIIADLGSRMKEALQTLGELANHKHENIGMINAQRDGIKSSLNELRRKINDYFDSLEKRMNEKLLQAHGECIQKLEEQTKDLEKRTDTLKTWQSDIKIIKEFGSDTHAFIMSKELENLVTELETFNKISTENFIGLNLTCLTSITVENLQAKVQALGEISVNKSSTELIITPKKSGRLRSKLVER